MCFNYIDCAFEDKTWECCMCRHISLIVPKQKRRCKDRDNCNSSLKADKQKLSPIVRLWNNTVETLQNKIKFRNYKTTQSINKSHLVNCVSSKMKRTKMQKVTVHQKHIVPYKLHSIIGKIYDNSRRK